MVSAVARRQGLTPQQLFTWREARKQAEADTLFFVPAVVAPEPLVAKEPKLSGSKRNAPQRTAAIELESDGATVKICNGVTGNDRRSLGPPAACYC